MIKKNYASPTAALTSLLAIVLMMSGCAQLQPASTADVTDLQEQQEAQEQNFSAQQQVLSEQTEALQALQKELQRQLDQQNIFQQQQQKQLKLLAQRADAATILAPSALPEISVNSCADDSKLLLGAAEWVWLKAAGKPLRARIDTGASTSSLSSANIETFERDGKNWVRFQLIEEGSPGIQVESRLLRTVKIRQASMEKGERRYVVRLPLQLGEFIEEAEFTLADRANMRYPVLLGREFLRDVAVVDVSKKYTQEKPKPAPDLGYLTGAKF
jgi:hypothetical protein